jgi:hypothetical protein
MKRIAEEVLADDRQLAGGTSLEKIVERAAEMIRLGQDRDRARAAILVSTGEVGRACAGRDVAGARRRAFDLRDQRQARLRHGREEVPRLARGPCRRLRERQRSFGAPTRSVGAPIPSDPFEEPAHAGRAYSRIVRSVSHAIRPIRLTDAR